MVAPVEDGSVTSGAIDTLLIDVDGTLVDSTYHHAVAWHRAFHYHQVPVPVWRVHRSIGMGGDRLVSVVAGDEVERRLGDALRERWAEEYGKLRHEVEAFDDAGNVLRALHDGGWKIAIASSGTPENTRVALDLVDADDSIDAVTTSEDTDASKPAPDILRVALEAVGGTGAVVVGDSPYDVESAHAMDARCIAVRTGGFSTAELADAGAALVFNAIGDLLQHLDHPILTVH
jgi:HAD superfamily hydrolase (TIGR01549 family)